MEDNIRLFVRAPQNADGLFTIEDAANNVLAWARTLEGIAAKWRQMDVHKTVLEGLQRQTSGSSRRLLELSPENTRRPFTSRPNLIIGLPFCSEEATNKIKLPL